MHFGCHSINGNERYLLHQSFGIFDDRKKEFSIFSCAIFARMLGICFWGEGH
jgi:hypothetical protein